MSSRTVLVIGGTGSIGRLVVARLAELGHTPRVLGRHPDRARSTLAAAELVAGDAGDPAALAAAVIGVDAVVMTHGAPYGSGDYDGVDYRAVLALVDAVAGRVLPVALMNSHRRHRHRRQLTRPARLEASRRTRPPSLRPGVHHRAAGTVRRGPRRRTAGGPTPG